MILRKKGFTLIEMLVVIMIIAILAAALFPAISAAIAQAKSTAMKNKGRGIWTAVLSANAEREPLAMPSVWPGSSGIALLPTSTAYFQFLLGWPVSGNAVTQPSSQPTAICEDLKVATLAGAGINPSSDPMSFAAANNAWCCAIDNGSTNPASEDAFIFSRNIDFGSSGAAGGPSSTPIKTSDTSILTTDGTKSGGFSLNRGIYVTYGGACIDRRDKYIGVQSDGVAATNNLLNSTNSFVILRP
jgi:prepilin-type N-terminal cleavage/methylation domain-containing protein